MVINIIQKKLNIQNQFLEKVYSKKLNKMEEILTIILLWIYMVVFKFKNLYNLIYI